MARLLACSPLGLFRVVSVTLILGTSGVIYRTAAASDEAQRFPMAGALVDVGGHRLHVVRAGRGAPTVVLESGLLGASVTWGWVQPLVAAGTTVVAYDRAGLGWSERGARASDGVEIARQLHALLDRIEAPRPLVLVGHSIGGLYVRQFQALFPGEVGGLVLVDASHPLQDRDPALAVSTQAAFRLLNAAPTLARTGLVPLGGLLRSQADGLPEEASARAAAMVASVKHLEGTSRELHEWTRTTAAVAALAPLDGLPLTVITAGKRASPAWLALQRDLARLSSHRCHVVLAEAAHMSIVTVEQPARIVAERILDLVGELRGP